MYAATAQLDRYASLGWQSPDLDLCVRELGSFFRRIRQLFVTGGQTDGQTDRQAFPWSELGFPSFLRPTRITIT